MILSIIFLVLGLAGLTALFLTSTGLTKKIILYILLFAAVMAAPCFLANTTLPLIYIFIIIALVNIISGFIYNYFIVTPLTYATLTKNYHKLLLITVPVFIGAAIFNYFYGIWYNSAEVAMLLTIAYLTFFFPNIFLLAFQSLQAIPQLIFPAWHFPQYVDFDFDTVDTSDLMLINIDLKLREDSNYTNFKVKAPRQIDFQYFFIKFITDYNHRNPENAINPWYKGENITGWQFFLKPAWYAEKSFIDPAKSMKENKLKESNLLIAEKVLL